MKAYAKVGQFGGTAPLVGPYLDADLLKAIYDAEGKVIWPSAS